ncbi:Lipase_GDSL domain-containing protein [Cinnamomum micranthum f. kanehirae]|uniref:Lipase_GDSL domain-containing protein n=1 Tax=Cinnamomum micranthum f. kanehirae TaxID=337451 RepID=A0A3S3QVJ2_9MAGN|nr:Lipase_GDSL domain-containing protein [Cinnamomum micranthum f. kanehirae]
MGGFYFSFCFLYDVFLGMFLLSVVSAQQDVVGGGGRERELVPAMFIFGDSLIDNGNNNNLPSFAKADYYPYGIDFSGGPTGRFSNGYTMVDEIAVLLGLPLIPPNLNTVGEGILHGVNYASAAAGILDITGGNFVGRIPFNKQIRNFARTQAQIIQQLGPVRVSQSIGRCIYFVGFGSNDYLNNYMMPNYPTRNLYNAQQFADLLIHQYSIQLTNLYNLGARKVVVSAVGILGCVPSILAQSTSGHCSEAVNGLVIPFNQNIRNMVDNLNANLPRARFIFVDVYHMFMDILSRPTQYGFTVIDRGCCGNGRNRGQVTCLPLQTPCANRDQYVWWDAFHPTAAVSIILGRTAFNGDASVAYPMNIKQLAELEI